MNFTQNKNEFALEDEFAWEFFDRYTDMLYIFKDINKTKAESAAVL